MKGSNNHDENPIVEIARKLLEIVPQSFKDVTSSSRKLIPRLRCVVLLKIDEPSESQLMTLNTLREFQHWNRDDICQTVKRGEVRLCPQMEEHALKEQKRLEGLGIPGKVLELTDEEVAAQLKLLDQVRDLFRERK